MNNVDNLMQQKSVEDEYTAVECWKISRVLHIHSTFEVL